MTETRILEVDDNAIAQAVTLLRDGQLVAFPTETVYGLGADACNDGAVASIFKVKGRPQFNPLITHVANKQEAEKYGIFCAISEKLAKAFWPGALTLVLPIREDCGLSSKVTADLETVGLRVPAHSAALALLQDFKGGLAAPSANPSGQLSPTEAEHVEEGLGDKISLILDGGMCDVGVESTIIEVREGEVFLLRPGGVSVSAIEEVIGVSVTLPTVDIKQQKITAPGQLESHYAPNAQLKLNALNTGAGEMFLAFGSAGPEDVAGLNLSPSANLEEAAANLYAYLHILDDTGVDVINVMEIPNIGLGAAINDRLRRAAAPREKDAC